MALNKAQREALKHPNILGAGAAKRRKLPPSQRAAVINEEFKRGTLHSGSGEIVTNPAQMRAIIRSEVGLSKQKKSKNALRDAVMGGSSAVIRIARAKKKK